MESIVQALFLAMALYPEVQKKAQAEIDVVVGPNRLPGFEDRQFLPYVNVVVKELLRWHLAAPLGRPCSILYVHGMTTIILRVLKVCPTWLPTMMNIMVIIFPKGQLYLVMHGQGFSTKDYSQLSVLTFLDLGRYCMTLKFLTTPWNTNLNVI